MADGRAIESALLDEITSQLERLSETRHRLARNQRILAEAATQLRLGRSAEVVLAQIRDQSPALLSDYLDQGADRDRRVRYYPPARSSRIRISASVSGSLATP